ncbi:hypothetical protein LJC64_03370 [Ruminococcaceae bacterium OttesenSCG-928-A11]|nr:hypothetical protein [Ruminococcaceae bacterium OttesenSCG-928-A11]
MQDDQKRPTVEDQELANMIANLNNTQNNPAPAETASTPPPATPAADPVTPNPSPLSSLPPIPPKQPDNQASGLPPVPPKQSTPVTPTESEADPNPAASFTPPVPEPLAPQPSSNNTPVAPPNPANPPASTRSTNNFSNLKPTPGLAPLPTNPAANQPDLPPLPQANSTRQIQTRQPSVDLKEIKQKTLNELRPLVNRLDLAPEEKFDTLLLLIRSTDDKSLIPQAYEAAEKISDETRRASALLDIVKEIDFFEENNN